jgi:hypothetical protein
MNPSLGSVIDDGGKFLYWLDQVLFGFQNNCHHPVENSGIALFARTCELDLEGIVAKRKHSPYRPDSRQNHWIKIRNRSYSQWKGRHELFERERHHEPVPGWHSCDLACDGVEA